MRLSKSFCIASLTALSLNLPNDKVNASVINEIDNSSHSVEDILNETDYINEISKLLGVPISKYNKSVEDFFVNFTEFYIRNSNNMLDIDPESDEKNFINKGEKLKLSKSRILFPLSRGVYLRRVCFGKPGESYYLLDSCKYIPFILSNHIKDPESLFEFLGYFKEEFPELFLAMKKGDISLIDEEFKNIGKKVMSEIE